MLRRIALVVAAVVAAVPFVAGRADAATGSAYNSPAEAGYAASGGHLIYAGAHITFPNASLFARELGRVEFGVQLWNASIVVDVGAVACTDTTCKPGGTPVVRAYYPVFRVFNRKTGALICSAALGNCPSPSALHWAHASFRPGTKVDITLGDDSPFDGMVDASVGSADYVAWPLNAGVTFTQARVVAEFGAAPFKPVPFTAPARAVRLATFFEPPGPPFEAEVANSAEKTACLGGKSVFGTFFTLHYLRLTKTGGPTHVRATAGALSGGGCNFSVYLEPV